jgi:hypothetical protein
MSTFRVRLFLTVTPANVAYDVVSWTAADEPLRSPGSDPRCHGEITVDVPAEVLALGEVTPLPIEALLATVNGVPFSAELSLWSSRFAGPDAATWWPRERLDRALSLDSDDGSHLGLSGSFDLKRQWPKTPVTK